MLYSYLKLVIADTLVGSFLDVLFLLLAVILSEFHEKPKKETWEGKKKKIELQKRYIEEFVWGTSLFWLYALLSMTFLVTFFVYSLPLLKWRTCWIAPIKMHKIVMGVILCDDIMSGRSKIWKSLAI